MLPYLLGLPQYRDARKDDVTRVPAIETLTDANSPFIEGLPPVWSPSSGPADDFSDLDAMLGLDVCDADFGSTADGAGDRSKRKRPSSGDASDDSGTGSGGGEGKQLQTLDEARARRRNYMRQKRAAEAKGEKGMEAQVTVLMKEDARLETAVQRMRQEAVALRQMLGLVEPMQHSAYNPYASLMV